MRSLYGSVPHRISHRTAMAMAPVAVKAGGAISVSGPPVEPEVAARLGVRVFEEEGDTLLVGAAHWVGATWVSRPERALLECLRSMPSGEGIAARVLFDGDAVSPKALVGLADRLGWDEPLRRVASIAARMDSCRGVFPIMGADGFLAASQRALLDVPGVPADADWICVTPGPHTEPAGLAWFRDERYRVVWCWLHPHALVEDLLY
ncbi:MAG: hypothetical protein OXR67_14315 [Chloroflexota bacterium]|nr:hypothetical protein [Chloroflexota bacterium]